jgi:biopolymer transport protein ExbD
MRAFRKRPWSALVVDLTPLIDVIFLIIIFFIIMINFSEIHVRNVLLPKADEARVSIDSNKDKLLLTIKSEKLIFLDRESVTLSTISEAIQRHAANPEDVTALIRASEDVPYEIIKRIMVKLAKLNIDKVEFATWDFKPDPLSTSQPTESPDET